MSPKPQHSRIFQRSRLLSSPIIWHSSDSIRRSTSCSALTFSTPGATNLGSPIFIFDAIQIDFSVLSHSVAHPDLALSVLEGSSIGLFLFLKSLAHSGLVVLVFRAFHGGFVLSLHSLLHVDFVSLVGGLLRLEPSALAFDSAFMAFLLPTRSYVRLDLVLLVADMNYMGSTLFVHSLACLGFALPAFQFNDLGFMLPIQSVA